ncbi:MAG: hypothetical protein Q8R98_03710, partial [Rubrivivax sp.]|nr:hypothetical protein [Rubrivivax sp.]
GHGLGLAIVAAVARMHGGTVFVERIGKANRVGLTLPARDSQAAVAPVKSLAAVETAPATLPLNSTVRPARSR